MNVSSLHLSPPPPLIPPQEIDRNLAPDLVGESGLGCAAPAATDDDEVVHRNRRTFRDCIQQTGAP
eukprot:6263654-Prorocentrum_lima.AAC.1